LAGKFDNFHSGMHLEGVLARFPEVERNVGEQIGLVQHQQLGFEKDGRVFEGLVFAFCNAQHHHLCRFSKIIAGRADQVADVFNQQRIERLEWPVRERALDHPRIQVAGAAGGDLLHRKAKTGEPSRIVIRLDVTRQQSYALTRAEALERAFKQGRLPCARRTDEVQAKYLALLETLSQPAGDAIVLTKNLLFERQAAHDSSTSR
jgi:hypothetical protein